MRINKYIAKSGICSRRKADRLIIEKRVRVNGEIVSEAGLDIKDEDKVEVDGKLISLEENFYIKLYKPVSYITSNYDPHNKKDLNDLISLDKKFHAAGRLDKDSEGLLIITNDGNFTNKLTHPSFEISKEYIVWTDGELSDSDLKQFKKGVDIGRGEITSNANINKLYTNTYRVEISQGYNRQIRRMFEYFKLKVTRLKRIRIGEIKLDGMKQKEYRYFNSKELDFVKKIKR